MQLRRSGLHQAGSPSWFAVLILLLASSASGQRDSVQGTLRVLWGDPAPGSEGLSGTPSYRWFVEGADGGRSELSIGADMGAAPGTFVSWNGRRVRARVADTDGRGDAASPRAALALTLLPERGSHGRAVLGSRPSLFLMCKFADIDDEPENLDFVQGMLGSGFGSLDDYWRENSYGKIDLAGSVAFGWVTLPKDRVDYVPSNSGVSADLNALFDDCTAAADESIDFSVGANGYDGVHLLFNEVLDCCAWGGQRWDTLDGVSKSWRTSWNPPWAFRNGGVLAHEMGHSYGLPHANNADGDGNPYDSPWDVMSAATAHGVSDPTYGALGKHHTAHHKDLLGWFDEGEVLIVEAGTSVTTTVDAMSLGSTNNHRMIRIPISGTANSFTVETRDLLGYDNALPGYAVIITHIDPSRSEPAWVVDVDVPPASFSNTEGSMFRAGETFFDPASGMRIVIDSVTTDGFQVSVTVPLATIFSNGFEEGNLDAWTAD